MRRSKSLRLKELVRRMPQGGCLRGGASAVPASAAMYAALSLACFPTVPLESFIKCFDEHLVIERLPQEGNTNALFVNGRPSGFWPSLCSSNLRPNYREFPHFDVRNSLEAQTEQCAARLQRRSIELNGARHLTSDCAKRLLDSLGLFLPEGNK